MKIDGNQIRVGNILLHENQLWVVAKIQHTQPGKGGAYMQVELKNIKNGIKKNDRFRSSETVEKVMVEESEYQFLYQEGNDLYLMHQETYEQISVPVELLTSNHLFLKEGMLIKVSSYDGSVISVILPDTITVEVIEADPVVKGQTASSSYKAAIIENGIKIMVPPYIDQGMKIIVDTKESVYIERAKE